MILPFFYRYIDDWITAILKNSEGNIKRLFNNYQEKIKFLIEIEYEQNITFLDLTLCHQKDRIKSMCYTKET